MKDRIIIIDLNNMLYRVLFYTIKIIKPKKVNNKYKIDSREFKSFFMDSFINNILTYIKEFSTEKVILAEEGGTWRKSIYPEYKLQRKKGRDESPINFDEFFKFFNEFKMDIEDLFPFKFIRVNNAEGDDVIAVSAEYLKQSYEVIVVSTDKDFVQLMRFDNIKIYNPIKREFVDKPTNLKNYILTHLLIGDAADNIPKITDRSEFTDDFKAFLRTNNIYINNVSDFLKLTISKSLINEYILENKNDIYKKTRFGKKSAENYIVNLKENLNSNKIHKLNFELNSKLILFKYIPNDIKNDIINKLNDIKFTHKSIYDIKKYCAKNSLNKLYDEVDILSLNLNEIRRIKENERAKKHKRIHKEKQYTSTSSLFNTLEDI